MIVKLQRPLFSAEPNPGVLVYNRSKSFFTKVPYTGEINKLLGNKLKVYIKAHIDKKNKVLVFDSVIPDRDW